MLTLARTAVLLPPGRHSTHACTVLLSQHETGGTAHTKESLALAASLFHVLQPGGYQAWGTGAGLLLDGSRPPLAALLQPGSCVQLDPAMTCPQGGW